MIYLLFLFLACQNPCLMLQPCFNHTLGKSIQSGSYRQKDDLGRGQKSEAGGETEEERGETTPAVGQ